jgi:hypothetical protein
MPDESLNGFHGRAVEVVFGMSVSSAYAGKRCICPAAKKKLCLTGVY